MGEVYRARDTRMGRDVAIKLCSERFSDRFEREVRAVAALNHPNICHIYDVGPNYLVMELVEGPTLADRIKQGAIPLEEALAIARQIGDALEAAHEKGIVHRDLKPANVKIRPDGTVKVLDFGLAKMSEAAAPAGNPDESPTLAMEATQVGHILGTAAYMAPEQARGKTVDKRADIWAFGVVLYEMLRGRRLFQGETISDTLADVLTKEPDWERVPAKAQRLLRSCLEKDPKRRLRDIGDAWQFLREIPESSIAKSAVLWKVVAGVSVVAFAMALWAPWRGAVRQRSMRVDLDLGPDVSFGSTMGPAVILSPDGARLVFVSRGQNGVPRLCTRRLDQPKSTQLAGTEGAYGPFFSPDGQWVGFFADGKLKKTRLEGGEPIALCDAPAGRGGSWSEDGNIIAALNQNGGLSLVRPEGGDPVAITQLNVEAGEVSQRWPHVLPGGKAALFITIDVFGNFEESDIAVLSLKDHRRKIVLEHAGMYPRYVQGGYLLYATKGALFARAFDPERLEFRGPAKLLWEVASNANIGDAQFDISRDGTLAYRNS
jgi:serine/threonine-protein kinase